MLWRIEDEDMESKVSIPVRLAAALLAIWNVPPAGAATIHKCEVEGARVVYQSTPCQTGERTLARWDAVEYAQPPEPPATTVAAPVRARRVSASRRRAPPAAADACAAARQRRDAIERRVGLARTYELLSALQREVYDACR